MQAKPPATTQRNPSVVCGRHIGASAFYFVSSRESASRCSYHFATPPGGHVRGRYFGQAVPSFSRFNAALWSRSSTSPHFSQRYTRSERGRLSLTPPHLEHVFETGKTCAPRQLRSVYLCLVGQKVTAGSKASIADRLRQRAMPAPSSDVEVFDHYRWFSRQSRNVNLCKYPDGYDGCGGGSSPPHARFASVLDPFTRSMQFAIGARKRSCALRNGLAFSIVPPVESVAKVVMPDQHRQRRLRLWFPHFAHVDRYADKTTDRIPQRRAPELILPVKRRPSRRRTLPMPATARPALHCELVVGDGRTKGGPYSSAGTLLPTRQALEEVVKATCKSATAANDNPYAPGPPTETTWGRQRELAS